MLRLTALGNGVTTETLRLQFAAVTAIPAGSD